MFRNMLALIIGTIFFSLTFCAFSMTPRSAALPGLEAELWLASYYPQMAKYPSEKQGNLPPTSHPLNNLRLNLLKSD